MSPLERLIRRRIAERGPMPLAEYMALCLGHPEHGYYMTRDPIGAHGDFVTAPEVSQLFGEMIGAWLAQVWDDAGRPPCILAELGPGRGTLMGDVLRVAARTSGFGQAAEVWLVETSPQLRARQSATLASHRVRWAGRVQDLPSGPLFLVANEFFDALPVRQFLRLDQGWQERVVAVREDRLAFDWAASARADAALDARYPALPEGTVVETSPAAEAVAAAVGQRIRGAGGAALVIDYGDWEGVGDTLQAVARHSAADPLEAPGEADLTAHVRFRDLAAASGLRPSGPVAQGTFLERLGVTARARRLAAGRTGEALDALVAGHRRLTHPDEMGHVFKAMALTRAQSPEPPGFAQ